MPWSSIYNSNGTTQWIQNFNSGVTGGTAMSVNTINPNLLPELIYYLPTNRQFSSNKTQIIKTEIRYLTNSDTIIPLEYAVPVIYGTYSTTTIQSVETGGSSFTNLTDVDFSSKSNSNTNNAGWLQYIPQIASDFVDLSTNKIQLVHNALIIDHLIQIDITSISNPTTIYVEIYQGTSLYQTLTTNTTGILPNIGAMIFPAIQFGNLQDIQPIDLTFKVKALLPTNVGMIIRYRQVGNLQILTGDSTATIQTNTTVLIGSVSTPALPLYIGFTQSVNNTSLPLTTLNGVAFSSYRVSNINTLTQIKFGARIFFRALASTTTITSVFVEFIKTSANGLNETLIYRKRINDVKSQGAQENRTYSFFIPAFNQENTNINDGGGNFVPGGTVNATGVTPICIGTNCFPITLGQSQSFITKSGNYFLEGDRIFLKVYVSSPPPTGLTMSVLNNVLTLLSGTQSSQFYIEETRKGMSFSISPHGYSDFLNISQFTSSIPSNLPSIAVSNRVNTIYHYTKPSSNYTSNRFVKYMANNKFNKNSGLGIKGMNFSEINWEINGFMLADNNTNNYTPQTHGLGWKFFEVGSSTGFIWHDGTASYSTKYPVGGINNQKQPSADYRVTNYVTRYINYQFFNLHFNFQKISGTSNDGINLYLSDTIPTSATSSFSSWKASSILIASLTGPTGTNLNADFYQLSGNKYITFVGGTSSDGQLLASIQDVKIDGGYHIDNNEQHAINTNFQTNITDATYSTLVGFGNNVNAIQSLEVSAVFSKMGNGRFNAGIWENGVWNSGWRDDELVVEFDDVDLSYRIFADIKWGIRVIGPSASVSSLSVGDKISIGNIVAIDINENRKLLKNYFTVISVDPTGIDERRGYIYVQTDTSFPVRRVERDSENHRIKITKNVWLNGVFLNGYFTGNWNNGLFKGSPFITEMYRTNWIDGTFDGGHFNSQIYVTASFVDTRYVDGKVGLTFSQPHKFIVGDKITIDKDDKTINPNYDGETEVIAIQSDYFIVTDLDWNQNSSNESGNITTKVSNGLIQNFKFFDNNTSKKTSQQSLDTDEVFIYKSWIDVNYEDSSAVNIGKPQTLINTISQKSYSENNLFGYPTYEVLSSESRFRDSFSLNNRKYKLGTKYKVFSDYVGDVSAFEDYFGASGSDLQLFLNQGWTFSSVGPNTVTFSRTVGNENNLVEGKELIVDAVSGGGVLDLSTPSIVINNREDSEIEKNRYTIIEFDLVTYSANELQYEEQQTDTAFKFTKNGNIGIAYKGNNLFEPLIHFNNINLTVRRLFTDPSYAPYIVGNWPPYFDVDTAATYLPVYQNINHLTTKNKKKVEYFYNKRNLGMHFRGSGLYGLSQSQFILDNLTVKEVDMIPFFKYFLYDNINKAVQKPFQGIAPYIDYKDANFDFVDHLSFGFDSFSIIESNVVYSGVQPGIGLVTTISGSNVPPVFATPIGRTQ
jgi:hypothetical protein